MLTTIDLDSQLNFKTDEVNDVRLNKQLAPKLKTSQTARSQMTPQRAFDVCRTASQ